MYTRYGHVNQVFVKVGDQVKAGQKIATNGTGNGQWLAHLHRDHPKKIPGGNFGFYNIGWTKEKTLEYFNDPMKYPKGLGKLYSHLGLDWLQYWDYGTNSDKVSFAKAKSPCYHPGLDENGMGSGNADFDEPVYAVAEGVVVYVANDGKAKNGGWGKLIVIEEKKTEVVAAKPVAKTTDKKVTSNNVETMVPTKKMKELYAGFLGGDMGNNANENEVGKLVDKLGEVIIELSTEVATLQKEAQDWKALYVHEQEKNTAPVSKLVETEPVAEVAPEPVSEVKTPTPEVPAAGSKNMKSLAISAIATVIAGLIVALASSLGVEVDKTTVAATLSPFLAFIVNYIRLQLEK